LVAAGYVVKMGSTTSNNHPEGHGSIGAAAQHLLAGQGKLKASGNPQHRHLGAGGVQIPQRSREETLSDLFVPLAGNNGDFEA